MIILRRNVVPAQGQASSSLTGFGPLKFFSDPKSNFNADEDDEAIKILYKQFSFCVLKMNKIKACSDNEL